MSEADNLFEIGNSKEDAVVLQMKAEILIALRDLKKVDNPVEGAESCIRHISLEELIKTAVKLGLTLDLSVDVEEVLPLS